MSIAKALTSISLVSIFLVSFQSTAFASFPDVPSSHVNYDAILYVQEQGIVSGYPDGTFHPDQTINRAEFTKIVTIASSGSLPTQGARACFSDIAGDEWFAATVCWALGYGAINGYPDGTFRPDRTINFAEAAKIIVNILDPHGMSPVPANEPWYRPYIQYLGEHGAIPKTITSFTQNITRGEMVEIIYRLEAKVSDKPSKKYEDFDGHSGWMSYVNADLGIIFDCPMTMCDKVVISEEGEDVWVLYSNDRPFLIELGAKHTAQEQLVIESSSVISDNRTNQGGRKVIYEVGQMGGANRQAIITCGTRTLLFPGVLIESEGKEAWNIVQQMLDNFKFTRC